MDNFLSSIKNKLARNDAEGPRVSPPIASPLLEQKAAERKKEEVRTVSKIDPNSLVDAEDIVEMSESPPSDGKDDVKPQSSKAEIPNPSHKQDSSILGFNILKKSEEDDKNEYAPNPIEDDIFIYYD